jgi:hypothetical protein
MNNENLPGSKAELLQLLSLALTAADAMELLDVAIRISEAIDMLEKPSEL